MSNFTAKVAEKISSVATEVATRSVGRSVPLYMHEVKVPEALKKAVELK